VLRSACRRGATVGWILDETLSFVTSEQMRAPADGAVLGGYDGRRWRRAGPPPPANVMSPAGLAERTVKFDHLVSETVDPVSAVTRGASGYGVRMLVGLATRLSRAAAP
jgi:hypothetical protein